MTKRETLKDKALNTLDLTKESAKQFGKSQYLCCYLALSCMECPFCKPKQNTTISCEGHGSMTYDEWVEWENQEVDE